MHSRAILPLAALPAMIEDRLIRKLPFLGLVVLISLGVGCTDDDETGDVMPLSIGNTWVYQGRYFSRNDANSTWIDTVSSSVLDTMTVSIQNSSYNAFVMEGFYDIPGLEHNANWLISNEPDGLYIIGGKIDDDVTPHKSLLIQYPYALNSVWSATAIYYVFETGTFPSSGAFSPSTIYEIKCVNKNKEVNTLAGKFRCDVFHYMRQTVDNVANEYDFYDYYAPGIGLVKREVKDDGFLFYQLSLISYEVN